MEKSVLCILLQFNSLNFCGGERLAKDTSFRCNDRCCKMVVTIITEDGWAYPRLIPRVRFGGEGRASFSPPTW